MEKIKLTKIYTTDKDKQGNALKSKKGYPYTRMSIKAEQYGEVWISGFQNEGNKNWREGDEVEVKITKSKGSDGKEYTNFEVPKAEEKINDTVAQLIIKMDAINAKLNAIWEVMKSQASATTVAPSDYPTEEIDADSIPF